MRANPRSEFRANTQWRQFSQRKSLRCARRRVRDVEPWELDKASLDRVQKRGCDKSEVCMLQSPCRRFEAEAEAEAEAARVPAELALSLRPADLEASLRDMPGAAAATARLPFQIPSTSAYMHTHAAFGCTL